MRGYLDLLLILFYSHVVLAFVIPNPTAFDGAPSDPIVEYLVTSQAQAQLRFIINSVEPHWGYPILRLDIGKADRRCQDTNITLEDEQLESRWHDSHATGESHLAAYGNAPIEWTIDCIGNFDESVSDGSPSEKLAHVLSLKLLNPTSQDATPAFTVSFAQEVQGPTILRFEPQYLQSQDLVAEDGRWRIHTAPFSMGVPSLPASSDLPSIPKIPDTPDLPTASEAPKPSELFETTAESFAEDVQKSLSAKVHSIQSSLYDKLRKIKAKWCPKTRKGQKALNSIQRLGDHHDDRVSGDVVSDHAISSMQSQTVNETRSLDSHPASQELDTLDPHQNGVPSGVVLKSFGLSLIALAFLSWLVIRCRDPRRRAERAAIKEERRTKRLYRRAARRQKVVNMIWDFRMRYGLVSSEVLREDEKRRRVSEQDEVLANVFKDEIQSLRNAHRDITTMTGPGSLDVEEGRSGYVWEVDGLGRRRIRSTRSRSFSTLPEYESEASRPPSYREMSRRGSYAEFTSDSSVVSTSPRISRDGTNSDFDEKIEDLDLRDARSGNVNPTV